MNGRLCACAFVCVCICGSGRVRCRDASVTVRMICSERARLCARVCVCGVCCGCLCSERDASAREEIAAARADERETLRRRRVCVCERERERDSAVDGEVAVAHEKKTCELLMWHMRRSVSNQTTEFQKPCKTYLVSRYRPYSAPYVQFKIYLTPTHSH